MGQRTVPSWGVERVSECRGRLTECYHGVWGRTRGKGIECVAIIWLEVFLEERRVVFPHRERAGMRYAVIGWKWCGRLIVVRVYDRFLLDSQAHRMMGP